jgi:hypothetical protein
MIKKIEKLTEEKFINKFNGWYGYCKYANEYNFLKPYFLKKKKIKQTYLSKKKAF